MRLISIPKVWSESIAGRCRAWTDEQMETAGILALVYGKFIEIWRERETACKSSLHDCHGGLIMPRILVKTTQLTNLLLSNASHEGINHIIYNIFTADHLEKFEHL